VTSPRDFALFRSLVLVPRPAYPALIITVFLCGLYAVRTAGARGMIPADNKKEKPYALIFGTVWGPDERPIYGVKVKIRREEEKKARWEVYSDHHGEFAQRVPAGKADYVIWPDLKGFKTQDAKRLEGQAVAIHVEYDERVDTGLHLK
jgi:hypothetical protein